MIRLQQNSFFGGQLDYEMMGRQDYQRYTKGATKLCNFNIMKRGGLDKRRGFDRLFNIQSMFSSIGVNSKFRMIPIAYKKTQGFVLVLTPTKCFVVGTNPVSQYKVYDVTNLDGVYNSSEIDELDYQQCGDVLFIAHQKHPPARIVHDTDALGEDGFHYEQLDFAEAESGIPEISDAVVTRVSVNQEAASTFTEEYKVSAIFGGVETFPCEAYKNEYAPNNASSWHGTSYKLPWTESQKIQLTIKPKARIIDGAQEYPDEIRVYKKAFNYFGLIGVIPLSLKDSITALIENENDTLPETKYRNSDIVEDVSILSSSLDSTDYGRDRTSWKFAETDTYTVDASSAVPKGYIDILLGSAYYEVSGDNNTCTMYYKGWTATEVVATSGGVLFNATMPESGGDKTVVIERGEDESDEAFRLRYIDEFAVFCASLTDKTSVRIDVNNIASDSPIMLAFTGGYAVINNIKLWKHADITEIHFDDKYITPSTNITPPSYDEDNKFSGVGNYPASVALTQQRLVWASTENEPARVRMSAVGDFYNYAPHEIQLPDDAIDFILPITRFAKINHICEMRKLLMFNSACEWLVDSASSVSGLTYETIQAYPQSYSGSAERLKPIICNNSLIFCERTKQAVRRFAYDIGNDGFAGRDVSILSHSIFEHNSIVDWTYQQFPYSTLWCVLSDGNLASFEYMEEQEIMAWMTHRLGGDAKVRCMATSYAVAPALDEVKDVEAYAVATHEELFAIVERNGEVWLERMRVRSKPDTDSIYHSLCLDGVRVLNSSNGLQPLAEQKDICWIPKDTTDGKCISRAEALAKIARGVEVYEGFLFDAEYISVYPVIFNAQSGNGQFDIKNICGCGLRLMHSYGGKVKAVGSKHWEDIQYMYDDPENDHRAVFADGKITLFNHDTNMMSLAGANTRDGRVEVTQSNPYPFTLLSYEIDIEPETGGYR